MTTAPFGRPGSSLLTRRRPTPIDVCELRRAAEAVLPRLATGDLRLAVHDRASGGAVVLVEEGELSLRVRLSDLAEDMAAARVPATPEGMTAALRAWVAHRPVTDAAARAAGVAVVDWTGAEHRAVGWTVVVPRGRVALPWRPAAPLAARERDGVRSAALARSAQLPVQLRIEGPVALWTHPALPVLATAVLAAPERMRQQVRAVGLDASDLTVVITPQRPVAGAAPSVAQRLAGQGSEDRVTLPWHALADLPWS